MTEIGRLGKLPAYRPSGLLTLENYLETPLPAPPDKVAPPDIVDNNWGMMGNAVLDDCTYAGMIHGFMTAAAVTGKKYKPPTFRQVRKAFYTYTHGINTGIVIASLLEYWRANKTLGERVLLYAPLQLGNFQQLDSVIATLGFAYVGIALPTSAAAQWSNNLPWTPVKNSPIEGYHCIIVVAYDGWYYIVTWGAIIKCSPAFLEQYMDEAWAVFTSVTPQGMDGLNEQSLAYDLDNLAA